MSQCKKCNSQRVAYVSGKTSDMCSVGVEGYSMDGGVPDDMNIGRGDYIYFSFCMECGQIQGTWPLPTCELEEKAKQLDASPFEFDQSVEFKYPYANENGYVTVVGTVKEIDFDDQTVTVEVAGMWQEGFGETLSLKILEEIRASHQTMDTLLEKYPDDSTKKIINSFVSFNEVYVSDETGKLSLTNYGFIRLRKEDNRANGWLGEMPMDGRGRKVTTKTLDWSEVFVSTKEW